MGPFHKHIMADSQKKLPTVPETLLKKRKQNAEFRAKRAKAALLMKKQNREKRKVMFKRAEKYVKEYRVMERDQIRLARQDQRYQWYSPTSPQGTSAVPSSSDQQRHLCASEQGNHPHAPYRGALHHHGIPQPEERTGTRLQAWIRQGRRPPCTPYRQRHHRERARQARYHLC